MPSPSAHPRSTVARLGSRLALTLAAVLAVATPTGLIAQTPLVAGGGFADGIMRDCRTDLRRLNQVSGWAARWPDALAATDVASEDAREAAIRTWSGIPAALENDIAALREGIRSGTTAPREVVARVLDQVDGLLATPEADSPLWDPARRSPDARFATEWTRRLEDMWLPALRAYREFLAGEYAAAARAEPGLGATPGGHECFEGLIERWTSLPTSAREVEAIGRRELARLHAELMRLASPAYGANLADVLARLRAGDLPDPFRTREDVVRHAEAAVARAAAAVDRAIGTPGRIPVVVEPMARSVEGSFPAGFYRPAGATTPAAYVVNTSRASERRLLSEAIAFHEAIPGHHTQAAAVAAAGAGGSFVSGLAEGWAIYAEDLADELGLYSSELDRIGKVAKHLWATSRLVVEPGLHEHGWLREDAVKFMLANTALSRAEIELEVDRYLAIPGQSLGYMLGNLHLRALRVDAEVRLGGAFDVRAFHDVILGGGWRPLPDVTRDVEAWVTRGGAAPNSADGPEG